MRLERVDLNDPSALIADWVKLRARLWPQDGRVALQDQLDELRAQAIKYHAVIAYDHERQAIGFAEASIRPYANGCQTSPVLFLEGIFVEPSHRRQGIATLLLAELKAWGRECGCNEMGSDTLVSNDDSHRVHKALGFVETERVVYFRQRL